MSSIITIVSILFFNLLLVAQLTNTACSAQSLNDKIDLAKEYICDGLNEEFTQCASSTCFEETCDDLLSPHDPNMHGCTQDCKSGCKCKPGYYRSLDGRCVDELTCRMCGHNEDWVTQAGYRAEKTCQGLLISQVGEVIEPEVMIASTTKAMTPGCHCMNGLYRSDDGLCVSLKSCTECGPNEDYEGCGSYCHFKEYRCRHAKRSPFQRQTYFVKYQSQSIICNHACRQGCKCHEGFYRKVFNGKCVSALKCLRIY